MGALLERLDPRHVFTDLAGGHRDDVFRELLTRLSAVGTLSEDDVTTVLRAVLKRERVGTTGIGRGVAIPHCKTPVVRVPVVAFGRTASPVDCASVDGEPVHSFFLVVSRPDDAAEHIAILRTISAGVRDDYYNRVLRNTNDAELLFDLVRELDGKFGG